MAKINTPRRNKILGKTINANSRPTVIRSAFKHPASPNVTDIPNKLTRTINQVRISPYNRPVLAPKIKMDTIREETPDLGATRRKHVYMEDSSFLRDLDLSGAPEGDNMDSSDVDTDFEGWDDESTLVAKLQDNLSEISERERLAALAHELEAPMESRSILLKRYLAHTIAPAAKKVKDVHNVLEQKVDNVFGLSVLAFDDACKKVDQMSLRDEDDIKNVYLETQRNVKELFRQLKDSYEKRDQLWVNFKGAIDDAESKAKTTLSSLPIELDDTISIVEKRIKDASKGSGLDGKAKQKLLRELLTEM